MRPAGRQPLILPGRALGRLLLALLALTVAPVGAEEGLSLKGELLVAAPDLTDPNFARTVVLMVDHDPTGAMGLVVNRTGGSIRRAELLAEPGADPDPDDALVIALHYGGPVGQEYGFVVHATGYADETTDEVATGVAVSVGQAVMDALGAANGPGRYKVLLGYAGWGPGQLEAEIRSGAWVIAPADPAIVFDPDDSQAVWERAFALRYLDL